MVPVTPHGRNGAAAGRFRVASAHAVCDVVPAVAQSDDDGVRHPGYTRSVCWPGDTVLL